jgi:hypothetical protein
MQNFRYFFIKLTVFSSGAQIKTVYKHRNSDATPTKNDIKSVENDGFIENSDRLARPGIFSGVIVQIVSISQSKLLCRQTQKQGGRKRKRPPGSIQAAESVENQAPVAKGFPPCARQIPCDDSV